MISGYNEITLAYKGNIMGYNGIDIVGCNLRFFSLKNEPLWGFRQMGDPQVSTVAQN